MSSWVSHLPPEIGYAQIIGHGMNPTELAANPRLSRWFVQDLNRDTNLPLDAGERRRRDDLRLDSISAAAGGGPPRARPSAAARRAARRQLLEPMLLDKGGRDLAGAR